MASISGDEISSYHCALSLSVPVCDLSPATILSATTGVIYHITMDIGITYFIFVGLFIP